MKLEYVDTLLLAHPFVKSFDRTNYCLNEEEQRAVSIGEVPVEVEKRTEKDLKDGEGGTVYTTTFYIGLQIERRPGASLLFRLFCRSTLALALASGNRQSAAFGNVHAPLTDEALPTVAVPPFFFLRTTAGAQQGTRKLDISYPTNEFTKLVKLWDNYDAETMGVIVRYIKRWANLSLSRIEGTRGMWGTDAGRVA